MTSWHRLHSLTLFSCDFQANGVELAKQRKWLLVVGLLDVVGWCSSSLRTPNFTCQSVEKHELWQTLNMSLLHPTPEQLDLLD